MNNDLKTEIIRVNSDGKKIYRWKTVIKTLSVILAVILIAALCLYGATEIALASKSFPITLTGGEGLSGVSISLSEAETFEEPTVRLKAKVPDEMTCISSFDIPVDVDSGAGSHNGRDYVAYTFYLRNNKDTACTISEKMTIVSSSKGADEAIRIRYYRDGEQTTYAKMAASGLPEYGTEPFSDEEEAFSLTETVEGGQVIRYTIVIWLEGDDPECSDSIKGGSIRIYVEFTASEA